MTLLNKVHLYRKSVNSIKNKILTIKRLSRSLRNLKINITVTVTAFTRSICVINKPIDKKLDTDVSILESVDLMFYFILAVLVVLWS
jgi:hypothetical protein